MGAQPAPRSTRSRAAPWSLPLPALSVRQVFARFWPLTKPFRVRLAVCLLFVAIGPAMDAAGIWVFKILIDDVLTPRDFSLFPLVAAAYVGLAVVGGLLSFVDDYLCTWVGERFVLNLRTSLFAHLHRMSLGFFERRQLGDLMSRISSDVNAIEQLVLSGVMQVIAHSVKILIFGGLLFYLNWKLALASLIAAPLFALASRYFSTRIKAASREKRRRTGTISAVAEESLSNAALVQAYDRQASETKRFHTENLGAFAAQMVATRLRATFGPFIDLLETAAVLLVIGIGIWQLAAGSMTLGGLLVFMAYLAQLYGPIRAFGGLANTAYAASAGAERIIEILDEKPSVADPVTARPFGRARGALSVENVTFTYPGVDTPSLTDLRFTIAPGQKLAVVGASGAGKTTLTKLLLRFYDPDRGRIMLDGVDLRELSLADLRRNLAAGAAGDAGLRRHGARQHPLGTARGARARRRRGGDRGGRPRVHQRAARRLRHPDRAAGPDAVRRAAAAPGDRPGDDPQRPGAAARRADDRARRRVHRARAHAAAPADVGPHVADHQPQPADRDRRRPDPLPGAGPDHGRGHARAAAVDVAGLRAALPDAPGAG